MSTAYRTTHRPSQNVLLTFLEPIQATFGPYTLSKVDFAKETRALRIAKCKGIAAPILVSVYGSLSTSQYQVRPNTKGDLRLGFGLGGELVCLDNSALILPVYECEEGLNSEVSLLWNKH